MQTESSLLYCIEAEETRHTTQELGIGFVAYSPLGRGLLTGTIQTQADVEGRRADHPRFQGENFTHNRGLVAHIKALAAEKERMPAQVTLAWLLEQGEDVVAISGTRSSVRLDENVGALAVHLTEEEVAALGKAIPPGAAAGTRYPAGGMAATYR